MQYDCINMRMDYAKERRQNALAQIIRSDVVSSQGDLADRLAAKGFAVTQATVSRDLEQIGAVKARRAGRLSYVLPDEVRDSSGPRLESMLRQWVSSIDVAMNMVVMKTPPGSAHLIGVALDKSDMDKIVGTICGDDTLFVACRSTSAAKALAAQFGAAALSPAH